tara:strand:- start:131 stop:1147 length:1017 start_codon:yes stop_codon:yes gene_type:complete
MKELYKAIDNLNNIISEENSVNEKIDLKTGKYKGTNITPTKKQLDRLKRSGEVPKNYKLPEPPLVKTNPTIKRFLDRFKDVDTPKAKDNKPKQNNKVIKKELPKLKQKQPEPLDKIQGRKKVKATAANTKDFDKTLALQKSLIAKGAKIDADGIMGPKTRAAMKKFMTPPPVPKMRPKTLPKSGGPDPRFITGPELDMPNKRDNFLAAPPERMNRISKNNQINSPGALGGKIKPTITPGPNTYRADAQGNYKKISPDPTQPKPGDSLVTRIGQGFNKMGRDLKGMGKSIYNFADKYGIASNLNRFAQRNQNKNKMASRESTQPKKTMIEEITGKKTCL